MSVAYEPEDALRTILLADPAVAALIDDRVYPLEAAVAMIVNPADASAAMRPYLPFTTYQRTTPSKPEMTLSGPSGLCQFTILLETWGDTFDGAQAVAAAIGAALNGYHGTVNISSGATAGTVNVNSADLTDTDSDTVGNEDGSGSPIYQISQQFSVWTYTAA